MVPSAPCPCPQLSLVLSVLCCWCECSVTQVTAGSVTACTCVVLACFREPDRMGRRSGSCAPSVRERRPQCHLYFVLEILLSLQNLQFCIFLNMDQKEFWIFSPIFCAELTQTTENMILGCQRAVFHPTVTGMKSRTVDPCKYIMQNIYFS